MNANTADDAPLEFPEYPFTPILGWSISRFEMFDKCKRQYFYQYYPKFARDVSYNKIANLRALTSVPLEVGNVVHDCMEALLRRLQKSDAAINEAKLFDYARDLAAKYFSRKTFMETYYNQVEAVDQTSAFEKVERCLKNFLDSPCYNWIYMKALTRKSGWMIEPGGYGETRINGLKAYCKMDFLFPVDDGVYILDWKTGGRDHAKHRAQLMGYAVAANSNFSMAWESIYPKIIYLHPEYEEFEMAAADFDPAEFYGMIRKQTDEMYAFCKDVEKNEPLPMEKFEKCAAQSLCKYCKFQELCG